MTSHMISVYISHQASSTLKTKELPKQVRDKVVKKYRSGLGYKKIHQEFWTNRPWIWHHNKPAKRGPPTKTHTPAKDGFIREATKRPKITLKELRSSAVHFKLYSPQGWALWKSSRMRLKLSFLAIKENATSCANQRLSSLWEHHPHSEAWGWHYAMGIFFIGGDWEAGHSWRNDWWR